MYGKIFETIFDSSIMEEDIEVRYVWHCLIVLADIDGNVDMTVEALARRINVTVSTVSTAVHKLSQPDARSRSAAADGRRLEPLDEHREWGWHLVNRGKYKDIRSPLDRRDYFREQKRRKRAESVSTKEKCGQSGQSTASTNTEAEAEAERKLLHIDQRCTVNAPGRGPESIEPESPRKRGKAGPRKLPPELQWRVEQCWEAHLLMRERLFKSQNGAAPRPPTLTAETAELIASAIEKHDSATLGADRREEWRRDSWARAAGIGIFLDPWMVGESKDNDVKEGGKKFLEPDRAWRPQRGKPDPVTRFGQLYFEKRAARELAEAQPHA